MARPPGSKNKAGDELRITVKEFVEANSHKFQKWLDDIQIDHGSLEAFKRIEALLEFCIPKLARSEIENKMSISFEPLVIERAAPQEVIDVTPVEVIEESKS